MQLGGPGTGIVLRARMGAQMPQVLVRWFRGSGRRFGTKTKLRYWARQLPGSTPLMTAILCGNLALLYHIPQGGVWPTCKNVSRHAKKAVRDAKKPPENPVKMAVRHSGFATRDAKHLCLEPNGNEIVK